VTPFQSLNRTEFVVLVATLISLVALGTDIILPALTKIGGALGVERTNDTQLLIGGFFVGLSVGQLLSGPFSDSAGRKPIMYLGLSLFAIGCVVSILAPSFEVMLAGRVLQGFGAAGPRIVAVAMVRDQYEGRAMARIMSFVMVVFITVPVIAPALGQGIMIFAHWRGIFVALLMVAAIGFVWLAIRQPETLARDQRRELSLAGNLTAAVEVFRQRASSGYMLAGGIVFGAFFTYLSTAQQIFHEVYDAADLFPLYFGILAVGLGAASITNANLVMRFGMRRLSNLALIALNIWSFGFLILIVSFQVTVGLWTFMGWAIVAFYCMGMLFSNFNALAMAPLGHIAGVGAAVVGSVTTMIAVMFALVIGNFFAGTVVPLITGFAGCGAASLIIVKNTERGLPDDVG
jgi:MFS transporter, DHA1 family, multidrug resistance protein